MHQWPVTRPMSRHRGFKIEEKSILGAWRLGSKANSQLFSPHACQAWMWCSFSGDLSCTLVATIGPLQRAWVRFPSYPLRADLKSDYRFSQTVHRRNTVQHHALRATIPF